MGGRPLGSERIGFDRKQVVVTSLDMSNTDQSRHTALVTDRYRQTMVINLRNRRGKGALPAVGEQWFIDRTYDGWTFAACVGAVLPVVTGARSGADPVTLSLLDALVSLGFVEDGTT